MSPNEPEPILRPRRYLFATRISIVAMALTRCASRREKEDYHLGLERAPPKFLWKVSLVV